MKLISWNVNGIRSAYRKGLKDFLITEKPDLFCLQEIKAREEDLDDEQKVIDGYDISYFSAKKKGYSGVATFASSKSPFVPKKVQGGIGIEEYDSEGRFLISTHTNFTLYNIYFPSGTTGDIRQDFKYKFLDDFFDHLASLPKAQKERLIICGDFNICHKDIDIHHPKTAEKRQLSGFLPDERKWMDKFVELGFVDTFRHVHGTKPGNYSWWSFRANSRAKNLGWRIDYIFVSSKLADKITNAAILGKVEGSDHCPVVLEIDL